LAGKKVSYMICLLIFAVVFSSCSIGNTPDTKGNGKVVMATYIPVFGGENKWYNWQYLNAWEYGGEDSRPDLILENGRRQIASVYYPMIGAYDSTDKDVLGYHIDIAKAMGIDVFQINYYADLNKDYLKTTELLVKLAEEKKFKISFLYEPKIHLQNWIKHENRQQKLEAVAEDIINIIKRYGDSEAFLKYRGRHVIAVFGVAWSSLQAKDWEVIADLIGTSGYNPLLIGDNASSSDIKRTDVFEGMFHWELYTANLRDADELKTYEFCSTINKYSLQWVNSSGGERFPVGIVFPGFNDSRVWGWDLGRQRVIGNTGKEFYTQSWDVILENKGQYDWLLIATFNDWNEGTIIEPDMDNGYDRAVMTQNNIEKYKDIRPLDDGLIQKITEMYLHDPNVKKYR